MKRLTRQNIRAIVAIALTAVAGAALAAIVWGVATTQGTRWLLTSVTSLLRSKDRGENHRPSAPHGSTDHSGAAKNGVWHH